MTERWVKTRVYRDKPLKPGAMTFEQYEEPRWVNMAWVRWMGPSWVRNDGKVAGTALVFGVSGSSDSFAGSFVMHVIDPPEHFLNGRPS